MTIALQTLLGALFPLGHDVHVADSVLAGSARTDDGVVTVIGTTDKIEVGVDHALALADTVLTSTAASMATLRIWHRRWTWHVDAAHCW